MGEGGAIVIDASNTMPRSAARSHDTCELTVVTNGPGSFDTVADRPDTAASLTGGQLDRLEVL